MAEGSSPSSAAAAPASSSLKGLREQMVAAAQALADERRNQSGMSASPVPSAITIKSATKPVIDGSILKSEERQRLARERREEREKLNAVKELQILDKERKAKLQYEKQMEEKQRRLREQKLKEQQRRAAVEEKRKQKIVEEKEHYEAVVHRTLERSQRLDTRQKRWSWGGSVTDSDSKTEPPSTAEASKRSTSTANLKQAETVINKRLSSSAALLNSPSKTSNSAISSPVHVPKVPVRSRSIDRLKASDPSENVSLESAQKTEGAKSAAGRRAPSPSLSTPRRSPSPANVGKHPSSPAARQKSHPPSPSVLRQRPPSPARVPKPAPIQRPSLTPNVLSITKKKTDTESKPKERAEEAGGKEPGPSSQTSERENAANASKTKEDAGSKAVPGTTTAEEAARILAEKRRLAREQREREDQERVQREEEERIRKEEMAKKALEEQAQLEAALCQLEEERRAEEEEQQKMAEEERIRREQEEQEKLAELLLQREEAEAKAQEEAERQRQERERIMQQNMQERLERKKRIEEIMKRTRKGDQSGAKNDDQSNAEDDGVEEDEELGLEKQDEPEKKNYIDCSLEGSPVVMHSSPLLQDGSKMEPDDVFINGGDQEEVDQRKDGNSVCFTQNIEASPLVKETIIKNSEILHVNEADHPVGFLSNLNGKSSTWSFEEYIDLGVHPKSTRLSSESIADRATQNLKDATTVPTSPKLAFEEESAVNSLIQPIETASVLVVDSCSGR
ncbi:MAP7 domain-containing protein 3 isoform X8 [Hemicordylus capensis]|uniref:MAP7 domain-containing protein 3 isoform X8 n=1 Tax=Hemicordylus capensis TaxID=884348 RepID=UPI0023042DB9|nr:MAP7 domain-containing protein 3 isoform X8 [Hemicordylus capensis]